MQELQLLTVHAKPFSRFQVNYYYYYYKLNANEHRGASEKFSNTFSKLNRSDLQATFSKKPNFELNRQPQQLQIQLQKYSNRM